MLAVCYNNIAVEHLAMRKYEDACVASQNARRLARLSLSYSNRYLRHFETTHNVALASLHHSKEVYGSMHSGSMHRGLREHVENLSVFSFDHHRRSQGPFLASSSFQAGTWERC